MGMLLFICAEVNPDIILENLSLGMIIHAIHQLVIGYECLNLIPLVMANYFSLELTSVRKFKL